MNLAISRRQFELTALASLAAGSRLLAQQPAALAREVPWLADVQTPPAKLPTDAPQLPSVLIDAQGAPITTREAWEVRRKQLSRAWQSMLGRLEPPRRPIEYEIISTERTALVTRRLIRYEVERNVPVEAYLLAPLKLPPEKVPGVVVLHSTVDYTIRQGAGLEGDPAAAWGLRLAERGMVTLCPRCFLWDGSETPDFAAQVKAHQRRHPNKRGMARMLYDAMRALDLLAGMEEVDPNRLGAAGHSLGAKEALYVAAFDERVEAAVSSEGGVGVSFSNWDAPWYLGQKIVGHDHHELLALAAPRAFLLIGGNSADGDRSWPFIERALEVYKLYGEPCHVGLLNHGEGHKIPRNAEGRVYEWLAAYL